MQTNSQNTPILGLHHVTAVASDPQRNLDFYTQVLGLRLVKLTVNFDDPSAYHFYFGDESGTPGTILTFFPWQYAARGRAGSGQVTQTSFAVPPDSLAFWRTRLEEKGLPAQEGAGAFGEKSLLFEDPDGMVLEMVETAFVAEPASGKIPSDYAIRGFHKVTLALEGYERTAQLLTETMGFQFVQSEHNRFRYRVGGEGIGQIVDLVCQPYGQQGRLGAGSVHHIAWRVADDEAQAFRRIQLVDLGYNVSPIMDRNYFHSIYFREPGGILFEIATDPPGFAADEPQESLGTRLMLPAQYERQRERVEAMLPPIVLPQKG